MKTYKRKMPLLSPIKMIMFAVPFASFAVLDFIFSGQGLWSIICGNIAAILIFCAIISMMGASGRYYISEKWIGVSALFPYFKKINYAEIDTIVISNASYNSTFRGGIDAHIPMQYRVKNNHGCSKVTFPFITLHTQNYPVNQIKSGMNSRELFIKTYGEVYCLGICWFAPFEKILKYTECNVFVLEDVYLRFKGMFDSAFSLYPEKWSRISIITTQRIDYQTYLNGKGKNEQI